MPSAPRPSALTTAGWTFLGAGAVVTATGALPGEAAADVLARVWPVLLFLALAKVGAHLLEDTGAFDLATHAVARMAGGRTWLLFGLFAALCVVCTVFLGLDTTAVMLTPLAVTLAGELDVDPLPFAMAALWLANTASLLLPVSNLTNLLAQERLGLGVGELARLMAGPQAVVLAVTVAALVVRHRRGLRGEYAVPRALPDHDPREVAAAVVAAAAFVVLVVAGVAPWLAAAALVAVLVAGIGVRRRAPIVPRRLLGLVPWSMAAFATGLFLLVATGVHADPGVLDTVAGGLGRAAGPVGPLALGTLGGLLANAIDNLPAYLALEPAAATPRLTAGLLVGVNAAPVVTPWGSLATLLWLQACRDRGLDVRLRDVVLSGLVLAPLVLLGTLVVPR